MSRSANQKLKLLYLMRYLLESTDEEHPVSTNQIIRYLDQFGITAERKSIYDDIAALQTFGLDIERADHGRNSGYYIASREFELPELKLLVDSIQSSKFITHKKTSQLIKKIETLASVYEAQALQRQVYVANRVKTMNESIYYNVDEIHNGISHNKKIRFKYFEYTVTKERRLRKDGAYYVMSPYALTWDNENYYLVAYDSDSKIIKHFRVDKMADISMLDEPRDGHETYDQMDLAIYSKKLFGMFSGEDRRIQMRFENHLVGAVLDRLGRDVMLVPDGDEHFTVSADIVVSPRFFGWLLGFGTAAQIVAPNDIVDEMRNYVKSITQLYI